MARVEDLRLTDQPLPHPGWSSYEELDRLLTEGLGLDLDDDPAFSRFCEVLRRW